MQVGTLIRSYDFPGNLTCYMVGEVTKLSGIEITCRTIKQVFDGKAQELDQFNETFRTVTQGAQLFDSSFQRIVELG